jgi:hypothetical protein
MLAPSDATPSAHALIERAGRSSFAKMAVPDAIDLMQVKCSDTYLGARETLISVQ